MLDINKTCATCRYAVMSCPISPCSWCSEQVAVSESKWEPISKADWIRSLSDEELASYLADLIFGWDALNEEENRLNHEALLSMLQEPYLEVS